MNIFLMFHDSNTNDLCIYFYYKTGQKYVTKLEGYFIFY